MKNDFRVRICSDLDYNEMVADVCYKNNTVAIITQEHGIDNMEIEILPLPMESEYRKFSLNDFLETILRAKQRLIEMQKPDE